MNLILYILMDLRPNNTKDIAIFKKRNILLSKLEMR